MKSLFLGKTLGLILTILFTWIWGHNSTLSSYNLQLIGLLLLAYFVFQLISRSNNHKKSDFSSALILTSICLLLIFNSGGLTSPLFFLLYFLIFVFALLFSPTQATLASVLLVALFAWQESNSLTTSTIINLASLVFITPLALIFSRNYLAVMQAKGTIKLLENTIQDNEIDSLLWISTQAKPALQNVLSTTSDLLTFLTNKPDFNLPIHLADKLKNMQNDLITLYGSANNLEKSIEKTSNNVDI